MTGATPPCVPLARHGEVGVSATVSGTVSAPPRLRGGRSRLYVSLQEGSPARTRAGRRAETSGAMRDRLIRAFLVVGGVSVACAWTWPGAFPAADPVAVLVRYHTPNVYRAVVAWYYVAPGVAVLLAGQFLISTSRIWFARMGVRVGLRSRLPTWPLSPSADGPAIVVGEVHHPVRAIESPAPEWLPIPERGLYTGVAIFGAVGSGKTSACMHPFARQLLDWQADNPERRAAAVLEVKGDFLHDIRRMLTELDRGGDYIELSLDGRLTWNPLSATWLEAYSLASLLNQLLGKGKEPFWRPCTRRLFLHGDVKPKQHRVHRRGVAQAAGLRVGARGGRRGHCGRHPALPLARGPRRQRRRPWPPSQRRSCPPPVAAAGDCAPPPPRRWPQSQERVASFVQPACPVP